MVERQPDLERLKARRGPLRLHELVFGAGEKNGRPQPSSLLIQRKNSEAIAALWETGAYEQGEAPGKDSQPCSTGRVQRGG